MKNKWGIEISKGMLVHYHLIRGGIESGIVKKIEPESRGHRLTLDTGQTCHSQDVFKSEGFYVEKTSDAWQSVFPKEHAELSQLHATAKEAADYIRKRFPGVPPIISRKPT